MQEDCFIPCIFHAIQNINKGSRMIQTIVDRKLVFNLGNHQYHRQYHPVLPAPVSRGKNLYVGTFLPLGQAK